MDKSKLPQLPRLDGVTVVGGLDRKAQASILQESEYLLFANRQPRKMALGLYLSPLKAQYVGCIPITTPHVAIDEEAYGGIQVPWNEWADTLIAVSTLPDVRDMALRRLSEVTTPTWDDVAAQWEKLIVSQL